MSHSPHFLAEQTLHLHKAANSFVLINTFPFIQIKKVNYSKALFMSPLLIPTGKIYPQSSRRLQPSHAIWVHDCLGNVLLVSLHLPVLSKTDAAVSCYKCYGMVQSQHQEGQRVGPEKASFPVNEAFLKLVFSH